MSTPACTLYVHLPWCVQKCPYCDFNSHVGTVQEGAYLEALSRDLAFELEHFGAPESIDTIFIGGGTPSLFSGDAIARLIADVDRQLGLRHDVEITLEANPGTLDAENFRGYRRAGVNRLSIGVQSFADAALRALGRIHDGQAASRAFTVAREAGFDNINLDLMHGLPEQGRASALADLDTAIALAPEHISWYQLTIEPNTAFATRTPPGLPDNDKAADIEQAGLERLRQAGYRRYEISAFARPRRQCRHNLNYWHFGDYLGIGAGAHGKRSLPDGIRRTARLRSPQRYLHAAGGIEALSENRQPATPERLTEFALNTLRVPGAFTGQALRGRGKLDLAQIAGPLAEASRLGLAYWRGDRLCVSRMGRAHLNRLLECFVLS